MDLAAVTKELGRLNLTVIKLHRWMKDSGASDPSKREGGARISRAMWKAVLDWKDRTLGVSEDSLSGSPRSPTVKSWDSCTRPLSISRQPFSLDDEFAKVLRGKPHFQEGTGALFFGTGVKKHLRGREGGHWDCSSGTSNVPSILRSKSSVTRWPVRCLTRLMESTVHQ
jgi:hypothetical protein